MPFSIGACAINQTRHQRDVQSTMFIYCKSSVLLTENITNSGKIYIDRFSNHFLFFFKYLRILKCQTKFIEHKNCIFVLW